MIKRELQERERMTMKELQEKENLLEIDKIIFDKEGNGYTMYINGIHCGWGDLEDMIDILGEKRSEKELLEYAANILFSEADAY